MRPAMVEKQKIIEQIHSQIIKAKTTIVVQFQGLDVSALSQLRKELRDTGSELKIYKNNLFDRALENTKFNELSKELIGPNAFIFGFENDLNTAKILANFAKKNKLLKLKAAIFENQVINREKLVVIASLPPKEILISMMLNCLQAPVQRLAAAIKAVAEQKSASNI